MKFKDPVGWAAAIGAGILVSVTLLPQARGEMVYEEQTPSAQVPAADSRTDDRQNLRQVIAASQKAQNTIAAEQPAAAPVVRQVAVQPVVVQAPAPVAVAAPAPQVVVANPNVLAPAAYAPAPLAPAPATYVAQQAAAPAAIAAPAVTTTDVVPSAAPASPEVQNLSKAELMRRERVREELRNEDVLQERLEQLRLRDEKRRTDELIAGKPLDQQTPPAPTTATAPGLQNELVVAAPTSQPGQPGAAAIGQAPAPVVASAYPPGTAYPGAVPNPNPGQPIYTDQVTSTASMTTSVANNPEASSEHTTLMITPHAGLSNLNVNNAFQVDPHFSAGIGLAIAATDNLAFEAGYSYNQYGISLASSNPFVAQLQNYYAATGQGNQDTLNLNQNVFEAGMKLSLLGPDSKVRPFLGAGGAYSKGYLNYSQQYQQALNPILGGGYGYGSTSSDYELSQYLGYLEGGVDVRLSKTISIGASFKYYTVLTSSENGSLAYGGFYNYGYGSPYYGGGSPLLNSDKTIAGASLSASSFYTVAGDVSFVF